MKTKKEYIAPSLKEYSIETELGFALSLNFMAENEELYYFNSQGQEQWTEDENTFGQRWQ